MSRGFNALVGPGLVAGAVALGGLLAGSEAGAAGYCQGHPNPEMAAGGGSVQLLGSCPQATIGTALIGAELVIGVEYLAGVHNRWVLIGSGIGGLVAGGVGGAFIDIAIDNGINGNSPSLGLISSGILAVGFGLVIPAALAYAAATSYQPDNLGPRPEDSGPVAPLDESTGQPGTAPAPRGTARRDTPAPVVGSLVMLHEGRLAMGVPAVGLASRFSVDDLRHYGQAPGTEWRIPVLSGSF